MAAPPRGNPTARRRQLARELRRLREQAQLTLEAASPLLNFSPAKLSKLERAQHAAHPNDVTVMLQAYKVSGERADSLIALAKEGRQKGWWEIYGDAVIDWFEAYIGLESDATSIHAFEIDLIPGLLQIQDYARSVIEVWEQPTGDDDVVNRRARLRTARQTRLTEEEPLEFHAVIGQAALHQLIGGPKVMLAQLESLISTARLANVTVQVLPFSAGAHSSLGTAYSILRFPEGEDDVVYLETLCRGLYVEARDEVARYNTSFAELRSTALSPTDSVELMTKLAADLARDS
ncbi:MULTISPECIES: helix-turn-helix domain-containing protein [Actinoalloteichus]|uniref:DNA binding protein with helix-turn-helix domain n=1 Tax=Actinoalloteichus fjordicus TaxID=1612552 RepID=A0AAC9LGV4_9PSEU|nr:MULTISPECIES: helix-turn-helix transcriptional regulator [Actinoalloteichus]APU17111.1 DNA binding protein with helix-turn-helix domain [Actinoalloteichus fjordicus]APU23193.1 DNA binding protein with helix-turn-helix domain [Actinoalloteichus sp. GBA129-24]